MRFGILVCGMEAPYRGVIRVAGSYEVTFDGADLPTGMYFARMQTPEYTGIQKLLLIK